MMDLDRWSRGGGHRWVRMWRLCVIDEPLMLQSVKTWKLILPDA